MQTGSHRIVKKDWGRWSCFLCRFLLTSRNVWTISGWFMKYEDSLLMQVAHRPVPDPDPAWRISLRKFGRDTCLWSCCYPPQSYSGLWKQREVIWHHFNYSNCQNERHSQRKRKVFPPRRPWKQTLNWVLGEIVHAKFPDSPLKFCWCDNN